MRKDKEKIEQLFWKTLSIILIISLGVFLVFMNIAPSLMIYDLVENGDLPPWILFFLA